MAYKSRLAKIEAELVAKVEAVAADAARRAAAKAKDRVPVASGKLRDAIHVERDGYAEYLVIAGDNEAFYGHIVEHGSVRVPPRPFMVPAAEATRDEARKLLIAALRSL
jgi:HK97 gp10 family phage protein